MHGMTNAIYTSTKVLYFGTKLMDALVPLRADRCPQVLAF